MGTRGIIVSFRWLDCKKGTLQVRKTDAEGARRRHVRFRAASRAATAQAQFGFPCPTERAYYDSGSPARTSGHGYLSN
jgi:hypothetical protein